MKENNYGVYKCNTLDEYQPIVTSKPVKTLSEYLKENNAYESFIENCFEKALLDPLSFERKRDIAEGIDDFFVWNNTKEGNDYWYNLCANQPKNLVYDMKKIVFAEVDKRMYGQKSTPELILNR